MCSNEHGDCEKQQLLGFLEKSSYPKTVIKEVTYCQDTYTLGMPGEFLSIHVDRPGDRTLTSGELERVNTLIQERDASAKDLAGRIELCKGLVEVSLQDGSTAMVCGAEITRLAMATESRVEA
jgi:hypothetical protein